MKPVRLTIQCLLFTLPLLALGQPFPAKPIRMVVPYAAGGSADTVARAIGNRLSETLGQPLVIDNRGGASGIIGSDIVAKAAPDGYTVLLTIGPPHGAYPLFTKSVPFDTIRDFTPITPVGTSFQVIVVHPSLPVASVKELIEHAKRNPGKTFYAIPAIGSSQHMGGLLLNRTAGINMVHVAYKGAAPALADVLGGQVSVGMVTLSNVIPHVRAGKLRMLAVLQPERAPGAPDTPTVAEAGVPGYNVPFSWVGALGPAALPESVVNLMNAALVKAIGFPDVRSRLEAAGFEVRTSAPQDFAHEIAKSYDIYRKIVTEAGIQPE